MSGNSSRRRWQTAPIVWSRARGSRGSRCCCWVVVLIGASGYLFARTENLVPLLQRWVQWDFHHYRAIAEVGYDSGQPTGEPVGGVVGRREVGSLPAAPASELGSEAAVSPAASAAPAAG